MNSKRSILDRQYWQKNALVALGGGPSPVINASLLGASDGTAMKAVVSYLNRHFARLSLVSADKTLPDYIPANYRDLKALR